MRLSAAGIALERGGREVFSGVDFEVKAGEALIVVGPNGAGKSSLLRVLAGFLSPSAGAFKLEGGDPESSLGEQAHYLGHLDGLKGALTAGENLSFWAGVLGGQTSRSSWLPALTKLRLAHVADFPVRALSAGQKRRVALARLAVASRPIWLLDEPTTALDVAAQGLFADLMRQHLVGGGLIIAATHAPLGLEGAKTLRLGTPFPLAGEGRGEGSAPDEAASDPSSGPSSQLLPQGAKRT